MYTDNRQAYRQLFFNLWQKHKKQLPLEPLEVDLLSVILAHPEYHLLLEHEATEEEFAIEENPFFHMSLHLALAEQLRMDRPVGIKAIAEALQTKFPDTHAVQHAMMTCLAQLMWQGQQSGEMPSDDTYLTKLKEL